MAASLPSLCQAMRNLFLFLLALFTVQCPAFAAEPVTKVHPAWWHVRGPVGEAWFLGSLHILPPDVDWKTPEIEAAMTSADTFVFEAALDDPVAQQRLQALVAEKGFLPPGQSLHAMLTPKARAELDAAITAARIAPEFIDRERPWLAALQLTIVDKAVMAVAAAAGKPERYFETLEEQLALFAPADPKLELAEFQSDIADIKNLPEEVGPLVEAWGRGDADKIDELMNGEMNELPEARTALIDDRNKRWLVKIEAMLKEKHAFFITVGAGHLAGPGSVPNLLRKAGYDVTGP
jgi:uncharacterized protein